MPDSQIFSGAVADAQSVYQLPGAVTFVLKAVNADFADHGAGSAWLPAVVIGSDSGHVIARAVDQAVQVAAGSDAACSFFPGVKHAAAVGAVSADAYAPQQVTPLFELVHMGSWDNHWTAVPVIDTACLHNGYLASDGTLGAFLATRFTIGPHGSIWGFNLIHCTGPSFGDITGYVASIPEDDPASGATDDTGLLQAIDTLSYRKAFTIFCFSAALTRNVMQTVSIWQNPIVAQAQFRVGGQIGDVFTTVSTDPILNLPVINGGPGVYALKLVVESNTAPSTGFDARLQALSATRGDWAWA